MSKEGKKNITKSTTYKTLKALYYSGKVKPSLNKILVELDANPKSLELSILACQCLVRTKNFEDLSTYANAAIELAPENGQGYYYKGLAYPLTKGKEQEALKNFNEALTLEPENILYLKSKATTHFSLYSDYHLPIKFAEKHRVKAEEGLLKVIELVEQKESASYTDFLTIADVCILVSKYLDAKKYYMKAVTAFDATDELDQDLNIYKDIISGQKACIKLIEKFTE